MGTCIISNNEKEQIKLLIFIFLNNQLVLEKVHGANLSFIYDGKINI
jgi:hypothetical protein